MQSQATLVYSYQLNKILLQTEKILISALLREVLPRSYLNWPVTISHHLWTSQRLFLSTKAVIWLLKATSLILSKRVNNHEISDKTHSSRVYWVRKWVVKMCKTRFLWIVQDGARKRLSNLVLRFRQLVLAALRTIVEDLWDTSLQFKIKKSQTLALKMYNSLRVTYGLFCVIRTTWDFPIWTSEANRTVVVKLQCVTKRTKKFLTMQSNGAIKILVCIQSKIRFSSIKTQLSILRSQARI